jgi:3-methyladenine DNA glycosylase AlkD
MKNSFNENIEKKFKSLAASVVRTSRFLPADYYNLNEKEVVCYNLKIPQVRAVSHQLALDFASQDLTVREQFNLMSALWFKGKSFESQAVALFWLESQTTPWLVENTKAITKWVERIHNWAHSDTYSGVLARIFESNPNSLTQTYLKWNSSKNPWKRRNSIVGLMLYSRMRKTHPSFQFCLKLVDSQKHAPEYYVQKAYGWTLREMYNVYPDKTLAYLNENAKVISPAAWYAATEKLSKVQKELLMKIRKSANRPKLRR